MKKRIILTVILFFGIFLISGCKKAEIEDVIQALTGSVNDPEGDAIEGNCDLVSASIRVENGEMVLEVRFGQGFDLNTAEAEFTLDVDEDTSTGYPGIDAANTDGNLIGCDYGVYLGSNVPDGKSITDFTEGGIHMDDKYTHQTEILVDGFRVAIPLGELGNDDGRLKFKVICYNRIDENTSTPIRDYMTDPGQPAGEVR